MIFFIFWKFDRDQDNYLKCISSRLSSYCILPLYVKIISLGSLIKITIIPTNLPK
jgi:hypothetical protein